jgi:hypothetical protein
LGGYCFGENDCLDNTDGRTFCNIELNTCDFPEGYCVANDDCINDINGKTVCNIELNQCEEEMIIDTDKSEFINNYVDIYCQKFFECDPTQTRYDTLDECKISETQKTSSTINSNICEVFDVNYGNTVISCTQEIDCSDIDFRIEDLVLCPQKYFMDMCSDGNGVSEASVEIANIYCDNSFTCDEANAITKYQTIENCINVSKNDIYYIMMNGRCPNYNEILMEDYLTCRRNLTCEQTESDCKPEFDLACNQ